MAGDERDDQAMEPDGSAEVLSSDAFLQELAAAPAIEPEDGDLVGRRVAHFSVKRRLGRGGMGVVYEARDDKLGRNVALKVLPPELVADRERRQRFLREARAAAAVTHPHLATVYEIGEHDELVFIAMELVGGQSLRKHIATRGPLPAAEALSIGRAVLRAVSKAHGAGIVHRDLKPDNVMLDEDGQVKVLDFGLAKLRSNDQPGSTGGTSTTAVTTEEGRIMGTPGYMSPEQATGKAVDHRTDLFAIGVMLYEMCCGERPFQGDSSMEIIVATTRDEPVPPSQLQRDLGPPLDEVILRALAKAPEDRHADADAMLAALNEVPSDSVVPVQTPRVSWRGWLLGAGFLAAVAALLWWRTTTAVEQGSVARTSVPAPPSDSVAPTATAAELPAATSANPSARASSGARASSSASSEDSTRAAPPLTPLPRVMPQPKTPQPPAAPPAQPKVNLGI